MNRKLTAVAVSGIKRALSGGIKISALMVLHGVGRSTISDIKNNKTWKEVA